MGEKVGLNVGENDGDRVGEKVGLNDGDNVGEDVGENEGEKVGKLVTAPTHPPSNSINPLVQDLR